MGLTVSQKIIQKHLVAENGEDFPLKREYPLAIKIDQTLTQDATGTMAYLQFEAIGIPRVKTELSVSYIDHNTLQTDFKNMDDHQYLQSVAAKYGIWFSRCGNGICHQVHLERFGVPGKTLLGSDSHTPTAGGLCMLAMGAGGLDVAVAMGGGAFHLVMPKIVGVKLEGCLPAGSSAKDIILELLRRERVSGGVGRIYEYFGSGVKSLTVPQRATITNMGAELGATSSIFPSDEKTKDFLTAMGRAEVWQPLCADEDAVYDSIINLDLTSIVPLAAQPHSPDAVTEVSSLVGKKIHQVVIGSCTNSSLDDLAIVASIVQGKQIATNVEAGIAPGSRTTLLLAEKAGILGCLIKAGFRILESACGPCIGMGFAPNSSGVSLRTFNRNFKGRSGTSDADVYLVSPQTAAVSAISGVLTNPTDVKEKTLSESMLLGNSLLSKTDIQEIISNDGMLIPPISCTESEKIPIERGPNIKACPVALPFADLLELPVMLKANDNVSTDDIMPAGAKVLPFRSNIPEIAQFTFERLDSSFYERAKKLQETQQMSPEKKGCIIIGGKNYGQGSSREHAALAPMYLGVRFIIVKSFARIHKANLINYGIIPLVFANEIDYESIAQNDLLEIHGIHDCLKTGNDFTFLNKTSGKIVTAKNDLDERSREILFAGGLVAYTRQGGQ